MRPSIVLIWRTASQILLYCWCVAARRIRDDTSSWATHGVGAQSQAHLKKTIRPSTALIWRAASQIPLYCWCVAAIWEWPSIQATADLGCRPA